MSCHAPTGAAVELSSFLKGCVSHNGCPSSCVTSSLSLQLLGNLLAGTFCLFLASCRGFLLVNYFALKGEQKINLDAVAAPGTEQSAVEKSWWDARSLRLGNGEGQSTMSRTPWA